MKEFVNCNIYDSVTSTPPPSANKAAHSGFETQRRRHQKSKTGVSVAPQKFLKKGICDSDHILDKFFSNHVTLDT